MTLRRKTMYVTSLSNLTGLSIEKVEKLLERYLSERPELQDRLDENLNMQQVLDLLALRQEDFLKYVSRNT